ncbi:MAG: hypothetical protein Q4B50_06445 [Bacillota bacterium]|nr:hypothetical protein [Bacillota bacterium]
MVLIDCDFDFPNREREQQIKNYRIEQGHSYAANRALMGQQAGPEQQRIEQPAGLPPLDSVHAQRWGQKLREELLIKNIDISVERGSLQIQENGNRLAEAQDLGYELNNIRLYDEAIRGRLFIRLPGEDYPRQLLVQENGSEVGLSPCYKPEELDLQPPTRVEPFNKIAAFFLRIIFLGWLVEDRANRAATYQNEQLRYDLHTAILDKYDKTVMDSNHYTNTAVAEREKLANIENEIGNAHRQLQESNSALEAKLNKSADKLKDISPKNKSNNLKFTEEEIETLIFLAIGSPYACKEIQDALGGQQSSLAALIRQHKQARQNFFEEKQVASLLAPNAISYGEEEKALEKQHYAACSQAVQPYLESKNKEQLAIFIKTGLTLWASSCMKKEGITEQDLFICKKIEDTLRLVENDEELKNAVQQRMKTQELDSIKALVKMANIHRDGLKSKEKLLSKDPLSATEKEEHLLNVLLMDKLNQEVIAEYRSNIPKGAALLQGNTDPLKEYNLKKGPLGQLLSGEKNLENLKTLLRNSDNFRIMKNLQPYNLLQALENSDNYWLPKPAFNDFCKQQQLQNQRQLNMQQMQNMNQMQQSSISQQQMQKKG